MICFLIDISSDIANHVDDTTPYEYSPYYDKLQETDNLKKYLIGFMSFFLMIQSLKVLIHKNF